MRTARALVTRHPLAAFVLLAYLLSWWPAPFADGSLLPHGPFLAAWIVVGLSQGKAGVKAWWDRLVQRGVSWHWYGVAVVFPLVIPFMAVGLNVLLGAQLPAQIDWTAPLRLLPMFLMLGGQWEEPGWTGYALPRLFERFGPSISGLLAATGVMAVIRTGWHLPLMLSGAIHWSDVFLIAGMQVVIAWLFSATAANRAQRNGAVIARSRGSVLAVMLLHLVNNIVSGGFVHPWFTGIDWVRHAWLLAALWSLVAVGVLLVWFRGKPARMALAGADGHSGG